MSLNSKLKSDILKVTGGYDDMADFNDTTSPSLLHEVTHDPLSSSSDGSLGPTMKDFETQMNHLKKENFNLKLRIYFLEERLGPYRGGSEKEDPFKKNIELKVETETLRKELSENQQLLRDAARAMDQLEKKHSEAIQKLIDERKSEKSRLELEIEKLKKECVAGLEPINHENSAAMYALAFGIPEFLKPNSVADKEVEVKLQQKIKELETQMEQLQLQMKHEKNHYSRLEQELANSKAEKEELDQEVEQCRSQMDEIRGKLGERDQELEEAQKQVSNLEEALMAKEPEIRIKVQELAERDKMIDEANSKLEAKEKVLVEIQITLDEKQRQIEALRASLASKDGAIAGLRSKLADSESATRELQDKMKKQWMDGISLTPKQLLQLEKNVMKSRSITFRNHNRGTEVSNGGKYNHSKRPGTAPPPAKEVDVNNEMMLKLQEDVEKWKKKAEEAQKEIQLKDVLIKKSGTDENKMKVALQGISARSKEYEREVEKCKQELRRKDKKIRDLLSELTVAHDQVNKAKWEGVSCGGAGRQQGMAFSSGLDDVKDMADEENERLWAELEDKKQKLKQLTDEKNTISVELETKIQSLKAMLKEKEDKIAGFEERNNALVLQLADKTERVKILEAQTISTLSVASDSQRRLSRMSSIAEWLSQQKIKDISTVREMFAIRLRSSSEEHSLLHSHIQKLQRNLRNTPEREGGPRGAEEEIEEARNKAEEVCALLGGHLWELATFLEGLLEETSFSMPESHRTSLRRALEWSRELSLSVLSTTGMCENSEKDCTRTSLAILRDFPSFFECLDASLPSKKEEEGVHIEEIDDHHDVEISKQTMGRLGMTDPHVSIESLHSSVEAPLSRVRESEMEKGDKIIDLREGSSEVGRGGNSGESVRTVRDARPSHLNLTHASGAQSGFVQKQDGNGDLGPLNCTHAGVIASPSESEGWSEPDRTVSLARMGLEDVARSTVSAIVASAAQQSTAESEGSSVVETRTPSKRSHGEVRRLQSQFRGLEQLIEALRAELKVYHSVAPITPMPIVDGLQETPCLNNILLEVGQGDHEGPYTKDAEVNTTTGVQSEPVDVGELGHLLEEVRCQRDKLEYSLKHNALIGQQLEAVLSGLKCHQKDDSMTNLCQKLQEDTEHLEEEQARCRDLQGQLDAAKSSIPILESKLQEAKDVELRLRALLQDKEAQIQSAMNNATTRDIREMEKNDVCSDELKKEMHFRKMHTQTSVEELSGCKSEVNISTKKGETGKEYITFKSFEIGGNMSPTKSIELHDSALHENPNCLSKHHGLIQFNSAVETHDSEVSKRQELCKLNLMEEKMPGTIPSKCAVTNNPKRLSSDKKSAGLDVKIENEMTLLRQALKEAQNRICIEELRARKAEEDACHWMEVAKEQGKVGKRQLAVVVRTVEDPSEGSSSSALSGILSDLTRQHSEMSDYVSDQTGGEESEPSLPQSPNQKRSSFGRPGLIPLEVSNAMAYLSPAVDISPTARQDAFSSPDLGIESDPGRFSSLENPPKSPEEVGQGNIQYSKVDSSGSAVLYSVPLVGNSKPCGTLSSSKHGKSADDLLSASCVNDLRLENERLRQCLAETRKNLDETMSKLEAANRRKLNVEKAICNQLQKTHHILRKARVNLGAGIKE